MDDLQRFVSEQNISRFVEQLRREPNGSRCDTLKRLLIDEEDRFGAAAERLQMLDRNIADGAVRIANQAKLVSKLKSNGRHAGEAEQVLQSFKTIQDLFLTIRTRVQQAAE